MALSLSKIRSTLVLLIVLLGLPILEVPPAWRSCKVAADCAAAGDGCRSCGPPIVVNKKHLKDVEALDAKLRAAANFHAACEACSIKDVQVRCERGKCEGRRR